VKKKTTISHQDKKDWDLFKKEPYDVYDKEKSHIKLNNKKKVIRLDLHGFSLDEANKKVEKFILDSYQEGIKNILVITGKGSRSNVEEDPYRSSKMNVLKNSVPEYIKSSENLRTKIINISKADPKEGGEGAISISLKNPNQVKE